MQEELYGSLAQLYMYNAITCIYVKIKICYFNSMIVLHDTK